MVAVPRERRAAIAALWALAERLTKLLQDAREPLIGQIKLAWWREEVANLYAGTPEHPVTRALLPLLGEFNLPQEHLQEIISGMEMDLGEVRYADFTALSLYCYRVASVVGLLTVEILV